jgi:hypothetical protein
MLLAAGSRCFGAGINGERHAGAFDLTWCGFAPPSVAGKRLYRFAALFVLMGFAAPFHGCGPRCFRRLAPEYLGRVFSHSMSMKSSAMPDWTDAFRRVLPRSLASTPVLISGILVMGISLLKNSLPAIRTLDHKPLRSIDDVADRAHIAGCEVSRITTEKTTPSVVIEPSGDFCG